jgi:hypothetical protein
MRRKRKKFDLPRYKPCGQCHDSWVMAIGGVKRCQCWLDWKDKAQQAIRMRETK